MKAVRLRVLTVLLTLCALVVGLTACQPKVGAAAVVGTERISEGSIDKNVGTNATSRARPVILEFLVKQSLYQQFLAGHGGVPSDAALAGNRAAALSTFVSDQLTPDQAVAALVKFLGSAGIEASFLGPLVRSFELEVAAIKSLKAPSAAVFFPQIAKAGISVSVAPRYGSWDRSTQDLTIGGSPSFLVPSPTASTTAAG